MKNEKIVDVVLIPKRIIFEKEGFRIYSCDTDDKRIERHPKFGNFSIKGNVNLTLHEIITATLEPDLRKEFSYTINHIKSDVVLSKEEQIEFCKCVLTESQFQALIDVHPDEPLIDLIDNDQVDITKTKGIKEKSIQFLKKKIHENLHNAESILLLAPLNFSLETIASLRNNYASEREFIKEIEDSAYHLMKFKGIGFKKADAIAMKLGQDMTSFKRINECLKFVLEGEQDNGHTRINKLKLINQMYEHLQIDREYILDVINQSEYILSVSDEDYSLVDTYEKEKYIAQKLLYLVNNPIPIDYDPSTLIKQVEDETGFILTDQQRSLPYAVLQNRVNVLTAGAGNGKSFLTGLITRMLDELDLSYIILSPSAQAAKVSSSYTDKEALTIHRGIGYRGEYRREDIHKLDEDFIIVDESGMADIHIIELLLFAIYNQNVRILFVGDDYQLASVGAGNFLYDIIHSGVIPVTRLDKPFRSNDGSIIDIATKIRNQEPFINQNEDKIVKFSDNCAFIPTQSSNILSNVMKVYGKLRNNYNFEDIFVLSATKKGIGTVAINQLIRDFNNPKHPDKKEFTLYIDKQAILFRDGDYVLNTKNEYNLNTIDNTVTTVINGDKGVLRWHKKLDEFDNVIDQFWVVDYDHCTIPYYRTGEMRNLIHSYSLTVHKSQGSGAECVIVVVDSSQSFQLNANILYTAVTRAKKKLFVIGQAAIINRALKVLENKKRNTNLIELLKLEKDNPTFISDLGKSLKVKRTHVDEFDIDDLPF